MIGTTKRSRNGISACQRAAYRIPKEARGGWAHEGGEQMMTLMEAHLGESHRSGDTKGVQYRMPMAIHDFLGGTEKKGGR